MNISHLSPENAGGIFVDLSQERLDGMAGADTIVAVPSAIPVSPIELPDIPILEVTKTRDIGLGPPRLVLKVRPPLEKGHDRSLNPKRQLHPVMQMLRTPLPAIVGEDGLE